MNTSNSKFSARLQQRSSARSIPARRSDPLEAAERAAIEIQREEHELKPDAKDILKAIFMWKDDPQERVSD